MEGFWDRKSIEIRSKIDRKNNQKSDGILDGLWRALGAILGGFWSQVGGQFGPQIGIESIQKVRKNQMHFVIDFLIDLGVYSKKNFVT